MKIYLVGGAVRDKLLNIEDYDKDYVVVGADANELIAKGFVPVGKDFPVFINPADKCEYALARKEAKDGCGYKGFKFDFNPNISLEDDLKRRDLTINAMAMDENGNIIDPYNGMEDLKNKVIRHVSDAFIEDPLRVLRVARFAAKLHYLGFRVHKDTIDLMKKIVSLKELEHLHPQRIWIEIDKALHTTNPEVFFYILKKVDALKDVLPELDALYGVPGPKRWHPEIDTFIHTMMTLHQISYETEDPKIRFAMLCHDLGKALSPKDKLPSHKNHNFNGLIPLKNICQRFKVPKAYEELSRIVVFFHSYMHHIYSHGARGIVALFDNMDAWRKSHYVKPFLLCCKCDFLGRKGFENRPFPRSDYIYSIFKLCQGINADEFINVGFCGSELKALIHEKRVQVVEEFLKTIPKEELDDSSNQIPPGNVFYQSESYGRLK